MKLIKLGALVIFGFLLYKNQEFKIILDSFLSELNA